MKFIIHTNPIPKDRTKSSGKRHYTPKKTVVFEDAVFDSVISDMSNRSLILFQHLLVARKYFPKHKIGKNPLGHIPPFPKGQPIGVIFTFYRENNSGSPDFDNMTKSVSDALNGLLWWDDSQIDGSHIDVYRKAGAEWARIELEVYPIDEFRKLFKRNSPEDLIAMGHGSWVKL